MELARKLSRDLIQVPGIQAVVLGGSQGSGFRDEFSDLDLGLYYEGELDTCGLREVVSSWGASADSVTEVGGWGPWVNGGGWLEVEGTRVDLIYRELRKVRHWVDRSCAGEIQTHHQPGHPFGFVTAIYPGEVADCLRLEERSDVLQELKNLVQPYPEGLRRGLVGEYLWQAGFAIECSHKSAARCDVDHVAGNLYQAVICMCLVLHGLNRRHYLNEKGAVKRVGTFLRKPEEWEDAVRFVFTNLAQDPGAAVTASQRLLSETTLLAK